MANTIGTGERILRAVFVASFVVAGILVAAAISNAVFGVLRVPLAAGTHLGIGVVVVALILSVWYYRRYA